ncbi:hypothetical protein J6590_047437 [Homalodisca vitripennis]|nr:hypothetical protein J6590_047437 [Homalodisca vitripennis]
MSSQDTDVSYVSQQRREWKYRKRWSQKDNEIDTFQSPRTRRSSKYDLDRQRYVYAEKLHDIRPMVDEQLNSTISG